MQKNNEKEEYRKLSIDLAISYVLEALENEKLNISNINNEITNLDDNIRYYNIKMKEEKEKEKENKNDNFFIIDNVNEKINNIGFSAKEYEFSKGRDVYNKKDIEEKINCIKSDYENKIEFKEECEKKAEILMHINNLLLEYNNILNEESEKKAYENRLSLKILETQEMERSRIARDLHDSTIQSLTGLVHRTELCTKLIDIDMIRAKLELLGMTNSLRTIINDMRDIIYNLKPMSLMDLGLVSTIQKLLNELNTSKGIQTKLIVNNDEQVLSDIINITLYRVIQEACNNIIKHAEANKIMITITYEDNNILIDINDNGKGFSLNDEEERLNESGYALGLSIMKERILLLSGNLTIESTSGKGTSIIINIPINNKKE